MRLKTWHGIAAAFLILFGPLGFTSCSSTQEQGQEEALESQGQEGQEGEVAEGQEGVEGQEGEGNYAENSYGGEYEEGGQENVEGYNGAYEEATGEEGGMDEEALANDEGIAQTEQQGDLQEIIEEMNQGGEDMAAADPGVTESVMAMDNPSNMSEPVGAAMETPDVENIATDPVAPPMGGMAEPAMGAPVAPGLPESGSKMSYIVQRGDTLAKIAAKIYGNSSKWKEIADFTGLANPSRIYPGDVVYYQLNEQSMAFASAYEALPRSEVQVQQGDTLSTIAGRVLGDSSSWKMIWRQNDNIENPDRLTVGTTLFYVAPSSLTAAIETVKGAIAEARETIKRVMADNDDIQTQIDDVNWNFSNDSLDNFEFESII